MNNSMSIVKNFEENISPKTMSGEINYLDASMRGNRPKIPLKKRDKPARRRQVQLSILNTLLRNFSK